jgi:hypothetical protein
MQNGHAETINKAIVDEMQDAVNEHNAIVTAEDPAPCPQTITMRRLDELLAQVSDHAVSQLRILRDDVDSTIRAIQERQNTVRLHFEDHVGNVISAVKFREVAAEHLTNVRERFARGL